MKLITVLAQVLLVLGIGYLLTHFTASVPVIIGAGIAVGIIFGWLEYNEMHKRAWDPGRGIGVILLALLGSFLMVSQFRDVTNPQALKFPDRFILLYLMTIISTSWLLNAFLYFIYPGIKRKQGEGMV